MGFRPFSEFSPRCARTLGRLSDSIADWIRNQQLFQRVYGPAKLKDAAGRVRLLSTGLKISYRTSVTAKLRETAMSPAAKLNLPRTKTSPNTPVNR